MVSAVSSVVNNLGSYKSTVNILENSFSTDGNFVNTVLSFVNKDFRVAMSVSNSHQTSKKELKTDVEELLVILLDKTERIKKFFAHFSSFKFDFRGYYLLVVLEKLDEEAFNELLKVLRKLHIINFCVIHGNKFPAFVSSFKPFEGNSCSGRFVTNELSSTTKIDKLFSVKRIDLKNCPIKITSFILPPFVMLQQAKLAGRDVEIINTLSQALNFKLAIDLIDGDIPWGYLYENGTGTGAIKKLLNDETDIILGDYFLKLDRLKFFDSINPYFESQFVYIIPPPSKLSSFEKLFQPFNFHVWITVLVCYLIGTLFILAVNRLSQKARRLIFGHETTSPLTNMFLILLGSSQTIVPSNNFPRLLLMTFVIFCMVIRSIFQGSLYRFLQSDGSRSQVGSVDEMRAEKFDFHIGKSFENMISETSSMYSR